MEKMALILSTFSSPESARPVLDILFQEKIITCAHIQAPHTAIYPWDGKLQEETETAVLFKSAHENKGHLIERLREIHPYDLPAIIAFDAEAREDYAAWLRDPSSVTSKE